MDILTKTRNKKGESIHLDLFLASSVKIKRHIKIRNEANPFDPVYRNYYDEVIIISFKDRHLMTGMFLINKEFMIILYSYPAMFGLPDNNPFGLKVNTYLKIAKIDYKLEYIIDPKNAPRGQLPYILDDGNIITDSNDIICYLSEKYNIKLDENLIETQRNIRLLVARMLDNHLYWVISYSRWQDERFWPSFKVEFLKNCPAQIDPEDIRKYNIEKYRYQGIGRYEPAMIYKSGIDDLKAISYLLGNNKFLFGEEVSSIDPCCYGFLANIYYFTIDTPLKDFIIKDVSLKKYVERIRGLLND